jgi:ADP-ribose pyrophosphatase YjhB (NUDIX family)
MSERSSSKKENEGSNTKKESKISKLTWKDMFNQRVAPLLSVDIIIRYKGGIVLIERKFEPFGWSIPGGFVDFGETVEQAAIREAKEETNLNIHVIRQFHVYSAPDRDPRGGHSITIAIIATGRGTLRAGDDAKEAKVFSLDAPFPKMPFDHNQIIQDYLNEEY